MKILKLYSYITGYRVEPINWAKEVEDGFVEATDAVNVAIAKRRSFGAMAALPLLFSTPLARLAGRLKNKYKMALTMPSPMANTPTLFHL